MRRATSRTVLASEPPLRASARCRGVPLGQRRVADSPCGSSCVTSRDASDRLLPSHVYVRVPAPRRFPLRQPLSRLRNRRDRLFHGSAIRFGGPHVLPWGSPRRACCSRRDACVPNLWHPCRLSLVVSPRSHGARTRRSRRDRLSAHPRERCEQGRRCEMPSVLQGSLAPQRPLERPAPDLPCDAAWPPRARFSTPFHPPERPCELPGGPGSRPRAPLPTGVALLGASAPLADFCNLNTTRGHTLSSRPILAREWGFRPATRRHQPMPVASASDGASPHRGPASHDPYAPTCVRRVPLARTRRIAGRSARAKANRALLDEIARALLVAPRAPGSPARCGVKVGGPSRLVVPAEISLWTPPREGRRRRRDRGAFCRTGTLTRAEDCSSVRAWTAAPSRRLRRGIARGHARLFHRFCGALL